MELVYVGPNPASIGCVPLPEGWPAANHEASDAPVKLAFRFDEVRCPGWGGKPAYIKVKPATARTEEK